MPNLILTPPDGLNIKANQAGDTSYLFPGTFGNPPGGNGGVRTPAATHNVAVTEVRKDEILRGTLHMTALYFIVADAVANNIGQNFHWAACTQTITLHAFWNKQFQNVNMKTAATQLFNLTSKDPNYK